MPISRTMIHGSVWLGGANKNPDVQLVQKLLNAVPASKGGPLPLLIVDGLCGPGTCGAIRRFQTANANPADGRIDPGKKTEQALNAMVGGQSVPGANVPKPPPKGGPQSRIRQRFMSICRSLLPPQGALTNGQNSGGASGTGCGEFSGRVFARIPVTPPSQKGAFKVMVSGAGNCYLHSPMTAWEQFAQAVDKLYPPAQTWVPFTGNRPQAGDIYVLGKYENPAAFQHVGIIVSALGGDWVTADGGQGNGWQSGFVKRTFHPGGQIDGEFGDKAMLGGWVNLDPLYAVAIASFPTNI